MRFPEGFIFGAATSAYQIEGAYDADGKGLSVWDVFTHEKGHIKNNDTGDVACDHYNRYKQDVSLMKEMGLQSYRFSINWPRVFPEGRGEVNPKGLEFYDNLVDELLENGIEPNITLYHWELPYELHKEGGWENRKVIDDFVNYAAFLFEHFKGRVKLWSTFNEPYVVSILGYSLGYFAPGKKDPKAAIQVSHNLNVAHAKSVAKFREMKMDGKIGIVHCLSPVHAMSGSEQCKKNVKFVDGQWNRWFVDASFKGSYPEEIIELREKRGQAPEIAEGDLDLMKANKADYLGINYYFRFRVFDNIDSSEEFDWKKCVNVEPVKGAQYTEMGWEVYPPGIYELLKYINDNYDIPELYITENGAAMKDTDVSEDTVEDDDRLEYIRTHLEQCLKAVEEGIPLKGFYYWSLMDNFEWRHGYEPRFGLVRVDYGTQKRTVKKSGRWYADFIGKHSSERSGVR